MKTGLAASIVVLLAAATLGAESPPLAIAPFDAPQARVH
jgi:hypothetical protein